MFNKMNHRIKQFFCFCIVFIMIYGNLSVFADDFSPPELYENSWRYENGKSIFENSSKGVSLFSTGTAWSKTDGGYVNDIGNIITGATKKGIDVSHHQGTIDWNSVKSTDVDYVIIRCGYGDNYTQYDDRQWFNNANACTNLEIPFGVYIYSYAASIAEAQSEAEHVLRLIEGYNLTYPIYLDMEDKTLGALNAEMLGDIAETFCNIIQSNGYDVGIYANKNWWTTKLTDSAFNNSSWYKWVAQYNSTCTYSGSYTMWQATSTGSVNGISGNVDIDFWFGDAPSHNQPNDPTADYTFPNTHINTGDYERDIVEVAKTQIGYTELTNSSGTPVIDSETPYYTKYGARYGDPNGHWCAYFVLWCAEQAGIPTSIICKSSSCGNCNYFVNWFKSNHRWQDRAYVPKAGDIMFFDWNGDGIANHVGIVQGISGNTVYTIEGNTGGVNGYAVMERNRDVSILGYGVPDYDLRYTINGYATAKSTAYMLPNSSSQTVWEIWDGDELQVLCRDNDYYLVLYPYVYTGKWVAAYVPVNAVSVTGSVPLANEYYNITSASISAETTVYHNASTDDLLGTSNNKIRSTLEKDDNVDVLFVDGNFSFIKTNNLTGYVESKYLIYNSDILLGDINSDGKVDSADAGLILRSDAGLIALSDNQLSQADVNHDGKIDSADAGLILRFDVGILSTLD